MDMNRKICYFVGPRSAPEGLREKLTEAVERHIVEYGVSEFAVKQSSVFDRMVIDVLADAKKRHPEVTLILVLLYPVAARPVVLPKGFSFSVYPSSIHLAPGEDPVHKVNQYMVRNCTHLIVYHEGQSGNMQILMEQAARRRKMGRLCIETLAEPRAF